MFSNNCCILFISVVDVRDYTTDTNLMKECNYCFEIESPDRILRVGADSASEKVCMGII
jgi:hypothetical protein